MISEILNMPVGVIIAVSLATILGLLYACVVVWIMNLIDDAYDFKPLWLCQGVKNVLFIISIYSFAIWSIIAAILATLVLYKIF